ncbi:MAG: T9SS type A sorting domain-containing protein [Bacteroidales bacterium]|nr:T9SS type A sorting domain-containing protein [Bacteroidales bacterium]
MKKFVCLITVLLIFSPARSQDTFLNIYDSTKLFRARDIAFNDWGDIFVCANARENDEPNINNYILKLDSNGNLLNSWWEKKSDLFLAECSNIQFIDNEVYLFGYIDSYYPVQYHPGIFMKKFDEQLSEVRNYDFFIDGDVHRGINHTCRVRHHEDKFIFFTSLYLNDPLIRIRPGYFELTKDGQLLNFVFDPELVFWHIHYDFLFKPDNQGFYTFMLEHTPSVPISGWIYDYDFKLENRAYHQIPNYFNKFFTALPIDDELIYLAGSYREPMPFINEQVGVMKMTLDGTALITYLFEPLMDSTSYPALYNSLDVLSDGSLIFCSSYGLEDYNYFANGTPTWISLFKFTPDLELIWHKFIGDGGSFEAHCMRVSHSDEIVIAGGYNPVPPQSPYIRSLMIMKTNSDGLITGIDDETTAFATTEAILFPNPAGDFAIVDFSLQYKTATLQLLDFAGRTVFERALTANHQQVDISGVPAGAYVYRIFDSKGLEEGGKLVVE